MIIRTQQHWLARAVDIVLTLIAWAVLLWLIVDSVSDIRRADQLASSLRAGQHFLATMESVLLYVLLGCLMAAVLFGWARYNQVRAGWYDRRHRIPDISSETIARSFQVDHSLLERIQGQQRMILHHDRSGALRSVELPGLGQHLEATLPYVSLHAESVPESART
jgi:biofilm PGA synthesis protein PgaD